MTAEEISQVTRAGGVIVVRNIQDTRRHNYRLRPDFLAISAVVAVAATNTHLLQLHVKNQK